MRPGHGASMTSAPASPAAHRAPSGRTTLASMPKYGLVATPGLPAVPPGKDVSTMPPVSDCQNVSTIGVRPRPTTPCSHAHASGLMGSPTEPMTRSADRSCAATGAGPKGMSARVAVGEMYSAVARWRAAVAHTRSGAGCVGVPSVMTTCAPARSGPYVVYVCPVTHPQSARLRKVVGPGGPPGRAGPGGVPPGRASKTCVKVWCAYTM